MLFVILIVSIDLLSLDDITHDTIKYHRVLVPNLTATISVIGRMKIIKLILATLIMKKFITLYHSNQL